MLTSLEFRDLPPAQVVAQLADQGKYLVSEATMYRLLRAEELAKPRGNSRPPRKRPREHRATGPNQVWSWDITYLSAPIDGKFYYLYLVMDVWSRKIVGWSVEEREDMELSAALIAFIATVEGIDLGQLVLHADNGGPMKGSTMRAAMKKLGIDASFSRPSVSNDNPFSESLFRTLKDRPEYPRRPFASLDDARAWVAAFVDWYNLEHRHRSIRWVTPEQRHTGADIEVLQNRARLYEAARRKNPERWSGPIRDWSRPGEVLLNPEPGSRAKCLPMAA